MRCKPGDMCVVTGGDPKYLGRIVTVVRPLSYSEFRKHARDFLDANNMGASVIVGEFTIDDVVWLLDRPLETVKLNNRVLSVVFWRDDSHLTPLPKIPDDEVDELFSIKETETCF
jgi:hypothetical protein